MDRDHIASIVKNTLLIQSMVPRNMKLICKNQWQTMVQAV